MSEDQPTTAELGAAFGLRTVDPRSLTPWSRVFRGQDPWGRRVVVKRTSTQRGYALAMARWTRAAAAAGLPVVAPADLDRDNPQQVGPDWWVVYPWVSGEAYTGSEQQVRQAGDLLGRQHALGVDPSWLRPYRWPPTDRSEIDQELARVAERVGDLQGLHTLVERWLDTSLPALRSAELPTAAVSSDFKANNLVFAPNGPVLVDPDNGGEEPRLFDLALAVLLFHNECPGAPGRLFTPSEWTVFRQAYGAHVQLTAEEQELWPAALDQVLWDEGSWALQDNDEAAWADPRQGAFLRDLLTTAPDRFPLG